VELMNIFVGRIGRRRLLDLRESLLVIAGVKRGTGLGKELAIVSACLILSLLQRNSVIVPAVGVGIGVVRIPVGTGSKRVVPEREPAVPIRIV
jgi:hypothetical protein